MKKTAHHLPFIEVELVTVDGSDLDDGRKVRFKGTGYFRVSEIAGVYPAVLTSVLGDEWGSVLVLAASPADEGLLCTDSAEAVMAKMRDAVKGGK